MAGFLNVGIHALEACAWIASGATAGEAQRARAAGFSYREFEVFLTRYLDRDHDDVSCNPRWAVRGAMAWIDVRIPVERALVYEAAYLCPASARDEWEPLLTETPMTQYRFEEYLRAGTPPEVAREIEQRIAKAGYAGSLEVLGASAPH